jgi:hypothetical protein
MPEGLRKCWPKAASLLSRVGGLLLPGGAAAGARLAAPPPWLTAPWLADCCCELREVLERCMMRWTAAAGLLLLLELVRGAAGADPRGPPGCATSLICGDWPRVAQANEAPRSKIARVNVQLHLSWWQPRLLTHAYERGHNMWNERSTRSARRLRDEV